MNFQNIIEIKAPVTEVFEFVADMRNTPKWNYFVTRVIQENVAGNWLSGVRQAVAHADAGCATGWQDRGQDGDDHDNPQPDANRGPVVLVVQGGAKHDVSQGGGEGLTEEQGNRQRHQPAQ